MKLFTIQFYSFEKLTISVTYLYVHYFLIFRNLGLPVL